MYLKLLLIITLFIGAFPAHSQQNGSFWNRMVFGGNIGAQFGDITIVEVAPTIGYRITDEFISGIGLKYIYFKDKFYNFQTDIYGGSIYSQYYFLNSFVAHGEIEVLNLDAYNPISETSIRKNITSVLVGGGLKFEAGRNTFITILGLWNLNETPESPYTNPIIRVGLVVGI